MRWDGEGEVSVRGGMERSVCEVGWRWRGQCVRWDGEGEVSV